MLEPVVHIDWAEGRTTAFLGPNKQPDEEAVMSDKELPSPEYLRQRLRYEPETGKLFWRESAAFPKQCNTRLSGVEAGAMAKDGYLRVGINKKNYLAHRAIWAIYHNNWPDSDIDHIDGDKSNNRICNLRIVSKTENSRNSSLRIDNNSGVTGVYWDRLRNKWKAQISVNRRHLYLGAFTDLESALIARKCAEAEYGFHANHGRAPVAAHPINC